MSAADAPGGPEIPEPRFGFWRRCYAMTVKEFIQLRRDRVSFAMIVMLPVMQLLLFGYAINTTPHNLPTAVLLQEDSDLGRSILKALENTAYFHFVREVHDVAEFDNLLTSGKVLFGVEIPRGGERAVRRGDYPALLVAADATDPVAAGSALSALSVVVQTALEHDLFIGDPPSLPFGPFGRVDHWFFLHSRTVGEWTGVTIARPDALCAAGYIRWLTMRSA